MHKLRNTLFGLSALVVLSSMLVGLFPTTVGAAGSFQAGRIIDNKVFFQSDPTKFISVDAMQSKLNSLLTTCDTSGIANTTYKFESSTGNVGVGSYVTTSRALYTYRVYAKKYPTLLPPNVKYDNNPFKATKPANINERSSTENPWFKANANLVCLKNFNETIPTVASNNYCGGVKGGDSLTAPQIIYRVSAACGINPKVFIVLLQKEQGIVTDDWPWSTQYRTATGYGCPDTAPCDTEYYGFFNQVYNAARQFQRYSKQPQLFNYQANAYNKIYYNPNTSCGFSNVFIQNQATAGLYNYTPYQPNAAALAAGYGEAPPCGAYGNRNFWLYYNDWFENPTPSPCDEGANVSGLSGRQIVATQYNKTGADNLAFTRLNNSGSGCAEIHTWNSNFSNWISNLPTALKAANPTAGIFVTGNFAGDSRDELVFVKYASASGVVEIHMLNATYQAWVARFGTNLLNTNASSGTFVAGDFNGDGTDELVFIKYATNTKPLEVHKFDSSLRSGLGIYDVGTDLTSANATTGTFTAGDFNGDGRDELTYIKYSTATKPLEIHKFRFDFRSAKGTYDVATNLTNANATTGTFAAGDFWGRGYEQLFYVLYDGSSGYVETHAFSQDLRKATGIQDVRTNLGGFDPSS